MLDSLHSSIVQMNKIADFNIRKSAHFLEHMEDLVIKRKSARRSHSRTASVKNNLAVEENPQMQSQLSHQISQISNSFNPYNSFLRNKTEEYKKMGRERGNTNISKKIRMKENVIKVAADVKNKKGRHGWDLGELQEIDSKYVF